MDKNDSVGRAVEGLVAAMVTAWNDRDARAYAALFAEDAAFTNVFGLLTHGRAAIERLHAAIFETMFRDSRLTAAVTSLRLLHPEIASVDVHWQMDGARDPQGKEWPERHGLMNAIASAGPGGWSFVVFHNQDLPPPERVAELEKLLSRG